jgi:hypothetical protein
VVRRAPHRFARQRKTLEAELCSALHLGDGAVDVASGDAGHRREPVVVRPEHFPRPLVVRAAHRLAELRIRRGPHGEALVREQHFAIDAVGGEVLQAFFRCLSGLIAQPVFALERDVADADRPEPFGLLEFLAFRIDADSRQTVMQVFWHPLHPEVVRLLHVAVGRDDEEFVRIVGPRGALPAGDAG